MPVGGVERLPYSITVSSSGVLSLASLSEGSLSALAESELDLDVSGSSMGILDPGLESGGYLGLAIYNPKTDNIISVGGIVMTTITAYRGDYGYDLMFTVTDSTGAAFDLSLASSVTLVVGELDGSDVKFSEACNVTVPAEGKFVYTTQATDFDTTGDYLMQVVIAFTSKQYTIGGMTLSVVDALPLIIPAEEVIP